MAKSISTDQREAPKKAATSPYRLPDTVTPIAYRLTIEPDLDKLTYNGAVEIDLDVRVPTKQVVVNALDLKIVGASLGKTTAKTSLDNKRERFAVAVDKPLRKGAATLVVRFAGVISETLRGFYPVATWRRTARSGGSVRHNSRPPMHGAPFPASMNPH